VDAACASGFKSCPSSPGGGRGQCVAISNPEFGCGPAGSCAPCELPNARATCTSGACAIDKCSAGYKLCPVPNGTGLTECVSLDNPSFQCGAAGSCAPCDLPNAIPNCAGGACAIFGCVTTDDEAGNPIERWANCDVVDSNGCESNLENDVSNCGECEAGCPLSPHARTAACIFAVCGIAECDPGYTITGCDGGMLSACEPADASACDGE